MHVRFYLQPLTIGHGDDLDDRQDHSRGRDHLRERPQPNGPSCTADVTVTVIDAVDAAALLERLEAIPDCNAIGETIKQETKKVDKRQRA